MEQYNVLDSMSDAMMVIGGLVLILVLLIILKNVHQQAQRIRELETASDFTEAEEQAFIEEETKEDG